MSWIKRPAKLLLNKLGYEVAKIDNKESECPNLPMPPREIAKMAASYFSASFPISPNCSMTHEEFENKIKSYFWHYPFEFGGLFVDSDRSNFKGIHGRYYQLYLHIFPAILSMTGGSLSGLTVLDIPCNAGFWSIQARLAEADSVLGVEASPKNVDQGNFILQLTGLDGIEYRAMNVYEVSKQAIGEFDITFFFGILYHLNNPIGALERLYEVTKGFLVVDTNFLSPSEIPLLRLTGDDVHEQNVSNQLSFLPSKSAVVSMLRHVGFRRVFSVQNSPHSPSDYLAGARGTFIAAK